MLTNGAARPPSTTRAQEASQLQLETLELLPCGCVVAIQRVRPSGVTAVSLEAKGPHCTYREHRLNRLIRLGEPGVRPVGLRRNRPARLSAAVRAAHSRALASASSREAPTSRIERCGPGSPGALIQATQCGPRASL